MLIMLSRSRISRSRVLKQNFFLSLVFGLFLLATYMLADQTRTVKKTIILQESQVWKFHNQLAERVSVNEARLVMAENAVHTLNTNKLQAHSRNHTTFLQAFGGSESAFVGDTFNKLENAMFFSDVLKMWERATTGTNSYDLPPINDDPVHADAYRTSKLHPETYKNFGELYGEFASCRFTRKALNFLQNIVKYGPDLVLPSEKLSVLLRCSTEDFVVRCNFSDDVLDRLNDMCSMLGNNVVLKEMHERPVRDLRHTLASLEEEAKVKPLVVQMVRDPRAVFWSMSLHGRLSRNPFDNKFENEVRSLCEKVERDIDFGKETLEKEGKYHLIRYEDFGTSAAQILLRHLYGESAALPTHSGKEEIHRRLVGEFFDEVEPDWWRKAIHQGFVAQVEGLCSSVMEKLGYKLVGWNMKLIKDCNHRLRS